MTVSSPSFPLDPDRLGRHLTACRTEWEAPMSNPAASKPLGFHESAPWVKALPHVSDALARLADQGVPAWTYTPDSCNDWIRVHPRSGDGSYLIIGSPYSLTESSETPVAEWSATRYSADGEIVRDAPDFRWPGPDPAAMARDLADYLATS